MNLGQSFLEALESLGGNKLRSSLTILGIVIGVAAVIAMLSVGQGAQNQITGAISGIGSNLLFVFQGNFTQEVRNTKPLTRSDAEAMKDPFLVPSALAVAEVLNRQSQVSFSSETTSVEVAGVTLEYQTVRNYALTEGEFISEQYNLEQASVAVVGPGLADKLFGHSDGLVGMVIRIEGQPFRIIGVLESKGGSAFGSQDDVVLIPFNTARTRVIRRSQDSVDAIYVQVRDADSVSSAVDEISQLLRTRHRTALGLDDFTVFSQQDFVSTAQSITGVFTIFLGGIAAISLLVGGIGIMNIMLVSVTERTREIGLRKALGARRRDILIQFLTESSLLSLFGGLIGIVFGWVIANVIRLIAAANNTPFNPVVGMDAILLATIFSTAVGLFFGIYPANRAASLQPVEALRHE